jgi:predicted peptidase
MHPVQQAHVFQKQITVTCTLPYLLYLPEDYDPAQGKRWPLVFFLHGAGERGSDPRDIAVYGFPLRVEQGEKYPFIMVSPQCPRNSWWTLQIEALDALLSEIESTYAVDPERIYLTGISMGGYGAWKMAITYPQRFAALVPICGGGNSEEVCAIRHLPTWVFHGDQDNVVPLKESEDMVNALKACGGNVRFTIYPGVNHNSWDPAYSDPELYTWLLSQRRVSGENNDETDK